MSCQTIIRNWPKKPPSGTIRVPIIGTLVMCIAVLSGAQQPENYTRGMHNLGNQLRIGSDQLTGDWSCSQASQSCAASGGLLTSEVGALNTTFEGRMLASDGTWRSYQFTVVSDTECTRSISETSEDGSLLYIDSLIAITSSALWRTNIGATAAEKPLYDGVGNALPIKLSTSYAQIESMYYLLSGAGPYTALPIEFEIDLSSGDAYGLKLNAVDVSSPGEITVLSGALSDFDQWSFTTDGIGNAYLYLRGGSPDTSIVYTADLTSPSAVSRYLVIDGTMMSMLSSYALNWSIANYAGFLYDVGLKRSSTGTLRVTDASTGYGRLEAGELRIGSPATPAPGSACTNGDITIDDNYIYWCTSSGWMKAQGVSH